jgi:hypothetical protein
MYDFSVQGDDYFQWNIIYIVIIQGVSESLSNHWHAFRPVENIHG